VNFFTFMVSALYVLFASRTLGLSAGLIGLTLGIGAVGAVIGAVVAPKLGRRFGLGPIIVAGCLLFAAPFLLIPLASGRRSRGPRPQRCGAHLGLRRHALRHQLDSLTALAVPQRLRSLSGVSRFRYGTRPAGVAGWGTGRSHRPAPDARVRRCRRGALGRRLLASPVAGTREMNRSSRCDRSAILHHRPLRAAGGGIISTTGSQMTWLALPWFVLTTTGSPTRMAPSWQPAVGVAVPGCLQERCCNDSARARRCWWRTPPARR
jgi:hypothetical protein